MSVASFEDDEMYDCFDGDLYSNLVPNKFNLLIDLMTYC